MTHYWDGVRHVRSFLKVCGGADSSKKILTSKENLDKQKQNKKKEKVTFQNFENSNPPGGSGHRGS